MVDFATMWGTPRLRVINLTGMPHFSIKSGRDPLTGGHVIFTIVQGLEWWALESVYNTEINRYTCKSTYYTTCCPIY
jgi:hypothetical protein